MKLIRKIKIKNAMGLHMRPSAAIVKMLQPYKSFVTFTYNNVTVNARSIISLLTLVAKKNSQITVNIEGNDAQIIMKQLIIIFNKNFE